MKYSFFATLILTLLITVTLTASTVASGRVIGYGEGDCCSFDASNCLAQGKECGSPGSQTSSPCGFLSCCNGVQGVTGSDVLVRILLPVKEQVFFHQDLSYKNTVSSIFHPPKLI